MPTALKTCFAATFGGTLLFVCLVAVSILTPRFKAGTWPAVPWIPVPVLAAIFWRGLLVRQPLGYRPEGRAFLLSAVERLTLLCLSPIQQDQRPARRRRLWATRSGGVTRSFWK